MPVGKVTADGVGRGGADRESLTVRGRPVGQLGGGSRQDLAALPRGVGTGTGFDVVQAPSSSVSPMPATVLIRSGIAERVWQARDVDLPQPDPHTPHLADVVPSVLAAMGVAGFDARIDLAGEVRGACVLLIDGLGAELLDAHADDAPVMAALRGQTLQAGFPSTTVAGLAAVGTGCRSGEHGLVGLSFRLPGVGV